MGELELCSIIQKRKRPVLSIRRNHIISNYLFFLKKNKKRNDHLNWTFRVEENKSTQLQSLIFT